jgi:formylglycine-generating enzyme required for sulfatase activity
MKKGLFARLSAFFSGQGNDQVHDTSLVPPYDRYALLYHLLPALDDKGMVLSPDRHIRLQRVLSFLPDNAAAAQLKPYLCPLFATDPRQQAIFDQLFDEALANMALSSDWKAINAIFPDGKERLDPTPANTKKITNPKPESTPRNTPSRVGVDLAQCTEPPYILQIAPKDTVELPEEAEFGRNFARLNIREASGQQGIDWPATLYHTVQQAGMPALHYREITRPVEYLLLLERFAADDHRALFFDRLYHTLRRQDVLVERMYHDGDLRTCYNEQYPTGIALHELRHRHADARLLVLSSGYRLLSTRTGLPAAWATEHLVAWKSRMLLTPVTRNQWGLREYHLKNLFTLLPAAWESLQYAAEYPDPATRYGDLPLHIQAAAEYPALQIEAPVVPALLQHFAPPMVVWIAACAIWPALHLDITLRLGRLLQSTEHFPLLRFEHLTRLAALPWFANGHIPKPHRKALLEYLEQQHPQAQQDCAKLLLELLHEIDPLQGSLAFAEHTMYLALLNVKATATPDAADIKKLVTTLKHLHGQEDITDFVLTEQELALLRANGWDDVPAEPNDSTPTAPLYPEMIPVLAGTFTMGSTEADKDAYDDEKPAHKVTVPAFQIAKTPITVAQFQFFVQQTKYKTDAEQGDGSYIWTGEKYETKTGVDWRCDVSGQPRPERDYDHPVIHISWNDARAYCRWLSQQTGQVYQLPTEAQWEYAARGGMETKGYLYAGSNKLDEVGWYAENSGATTHPVAQKAPNELDLYDMSGLVWEWCEDDWHQDYKKAPTDGSAWIDHPDRGASRVVRGGCWLSDARHCRTASRSTDAPSLRHYDLGFRPVCFLPQ